MKGPKKPAKAKTPKAPPKEKKAKPDKKVKSAEKQQADSGKTRFAGVNADDKALFLHHLGKLPAIIKAKDDAVNAIRTFYKSAKIDGFLKADFDAAAELQKANGEKNKKAAIARHLTIAKWLGFDLGSQLDLFVEDERVPAEDRAYTEGQDCSMEGKTPKPEYHPATAQHRSYMQGYNDDQERIAKGIQKLEPKEGAPAFEDTKPAPTGVVPIPSPASGVAMTREDYKKAQAQAQSN